VGAATINSAKKHERSVKRRGDFFIGVNDYVKEDAVKLKLAPAGDK
jgi:hypothetical protein